MESYFLIGHLSKDGKSIYYSAHSSNLYGIINKFEISTKSKTPISKPEDNFYYPKISPDGNMVAFQKFDGSWIYIGLMTSNGETPIIIDKGYNPEFSQDGKSIFFIGHQGIGIYDIQSKNKKIFPNTDVGSLDLEVY